MTEADKNKVIEIFKLYRYNVIDNHDGYLIFILDSGMYPGAEIINIGTHSDEEVAKKINEYRDLSFNAREYRYTTIENLEKFLFNGFFQVKAANQRNGKRYHDYITSILEPYRDTGEYSIIGINYEYINISYLREFNFDKSASNQSLVESIRTDLANSRASLIIVEAGAGFGKTSTAFEILKGYTDSDKDVRPFFMELAKDRKATTFQYLLLNQIDKNFDTSLKEDVVIHNIKAGRIPLIIDGFDELLSRDMDTGYSDAKFQEVETMLSTIAELLTRKTKIVLTSRKTAIFDSGAFYEWFEHQLKNGKDFDVIRYQLREPSINDWMDASRRSKLPRELESLNNPVLLTFLKFVPIDEIEKYGSQKVLIDSYFSFLLKREIQRQNLPFSVEDQIAIFEKLAAYFGGYDVTNLKRKEVQDALLELSRSSIVSKCALDTDIDWLTNALTNHALLDRKDNGNIGFFNEFILGQLLVKSFVDDEENQLIEYHKAFAFSFLFKTIQAGKLLDDNIKTMLYSRIIEFCKPSPVLTLLADLLLTNKTNHKIIGGQFNLEMISNAEIGTEHGTLEKCHFTNTIFKQCTLNFAYIPEAMFYGCTFIDCNGNASDNILFFGCTGQDIFLPSVDISETIDDSYIELNKDLKIQLLERYFKADRQTTRVVRISSLKKEYDERTLVKCISLLESQNLIKVYGDKSYINANGINFLKAHRNE